MKLPKELPQKRDTWYRELRGPVLKQLEPLANDFEKYLNAGSQWMREIMDRFEGCINRAYNLKEDSDCGPLKIGLVAGYLAWSSEIDFTPDLKGRKMSPSVSKKLKKIPGFMRPTQNVCWEISRKIYNVMGRQSVEIQIAFLNGYHRALDKPRFSGQAPVFWESTATRIYVALLLLAPSMDKIKNVSHLYKILTPILGVSALGPLNEVKQCKQLGKLCERIGLKFRKYSHPRSTVAAMVAA